MAYRVRSSSGRRLLAAVLSVDVEDADATKAGYIVMACIVMACTVMACIVMACIVMACIVMACIVMADAALLPDDLASLKVPNNISVILTDYAVRHISHCHPARKPWEYQGPSILVSDCNA